MSAPELASGMNRSGAAEARRLLAAALREAADRLAAEEGDGSPAAPPAGEQQAPRLTLTVGEVAAALGVSRGTAYRLVQTKAIPSLRLGSRIVVPVDALRRCMDGGSAIARG